MTYQNCDELQREREEERKGGGEEREVEEGEKRNKALFKDTKNKLEQQMTTVTARSLNISKPL